MEIDVRFSEGSVLYFNPFVFPDGGTPKSKYFIVLKHVGKKLLLASLPTSKDNVPSFITKFHGCIENPDINLIVTILTLLSRFAITAFLFQWKPTFMVFG